VTLMRDFLLRMLRVPPQPDPPPGDPQRLHTFRAGRGYYRYRMMMWLLTQAGTVAGALAGYFFVVVVIDEIGIASRWLRFAGVVGIAGVLAQIPISFAVMKLNYELRWYMLTDRSLRIRNGILGVREQTMMFANVQNISILQNPIQRIFGIANVAVRTAGGGTGGGYPPGAGTQGSGMHEAVFEGVDNAEEIRAVIRDRIREQRDAGLGDPEDVHPEHQDETADPVLAAARVLRDEARSLRATFAAG
jgi:uncharacterized membrane protein YdbT with pleckstrin-like domain